MKKRRILPAFFVLCVIFAIVPRPGAAAAGMSGLEVIGQTAMTQQTFSDLSVIGADSCGLTDAINGAKNPAQTIGEWIKGYWDQWLLRQQLTWGTVLNIAAAGARYTGNGDLLFNSQLSDLFTRFYNWLWDGDQGPNIKDNAPVISNGDILNIDISKVDKNILFHPTYNYDLKFTKKLNGQYMSGGYYSFTSDNAWLIFLQTSDAYCNAYFFSLSNDAVVSRSNGTQWRTTRTLNTKIGTVYYYDYSSSYYILSTCNVVSKVTNNSSLSSDYQTLCDIAYILFGSGAAIGDDQILGDPDKLGGLTGSERKRVAPPDIINFPDFGGNSGSIDISDYLGGLRGAIESQDGTADVNITDAEGVQSTETMTIDQATDIPAETETTAEAVNQGELISTATPSTELADYTIDLRNYFPFCIPWDLYDMITLLVADPVAPHVQYPFVIEPLNVNYMIDLDFSQFDSVAAVLRTMELLAAGIGLALMTKRLIQGGD